MNDKKSGSVRVRFAPSPTGHLHIGSLRAALFNWLFAKHHNGKFLVRVEDTDRARSTKEFEDSIVQSLQWTGITSDEPIVYQYARLDIHKKMIDQLVAQGKAYKCYCPQEELQSKKDQALSRQETYQYDKSCRILSRDKDSDDQSYVVRFQVDTEQEFFEFQDLVRGTVSIPTVQIDDFIILRSDGTVTYNFAVVQDDHDMNITHIIRGEDHLINTVKQILLHRALGYQLPTFAHIPLVLGSAGQKLSKRDAVTSVVAYKDEGYLAEALCNYLVRLGWSHGDQELFSKDEMIKFFSLDHVHSSGAKFDKDKLNWMNGVYIKDLAPEKIIEILQQDMNLNLAAVTVDWADEQRVSWIQLYQDRVATLKELYDHIVLAYSLPVSYDWDGLKKIVAKDGIVILQLLQQEFENVEFDKKMLLTLTKAFCKTHEYKIAHIAQLLRFALLGVVSGPSVFDMMVLFGKKEVRRRISHVLSVL